MAVTRKFKETVAKRLKADPALRAAMLSEAMEALLRGEKALGCLLLRDFIKSTVGFVELARLTGKSSKSLMRMLSEDGNPTIENMGLILKHLTAREGHQVSVKLDDAA